MKEKIKRIENAFSKRRIPVEIITTDGLSMDEYGEAKRFTEVLAKDLKCDHLEKYYEAIYWLSPEAFCYYLPGIMLAGIRENEPNLLINYSIIRMIDRTPDPSFWDDFFLKRWPLLTQNECGAVQEWVLWLSSFDKDSFDDMSLSRAFDTLELLKRVNHKSV